MYLPRRERNINSKERMRERRMRRRLSEYEANRRRSKHGGSHRSGGRGGGAGGVGVTKGDWEVHFVPAQATIWQPGMRPRTYGEPVVRVRR